MDPKPKHFFTVEAAVARVRNTGHCDLCAVMPLELERMMALFGLNQAQLAKRADLGNSYIGQVRKLEKFPGMDWWDKVADHFGMPLEDFIAEARLILRGKIAL